ncbi:hypothetical protein QBC47DRAFT_370341 [Echria macrotheca]|uniref:Nicotinamide-nucleotide adenylyltransferase n=1 Tax=Echria macrotheca TaxID=438768 RepID=A0AAJ0BNF2_9PEZI|nr:hypothetical protein QBC47DRAFT_370341 [Echria macrotheca]
MSSSETPAVPVVDQSMRAQSLLTSGGGGSARLLVDFFSRAITTFQHSESPFQVICTLSPTASRSPSDNAQAHLPAPVAPRSKPKTLIVLDSSFNPPTRAHLRMATSAIHDISGASSLGMGSLRLLLLLAINNADKAPKPAAFHQRLAMMWAFAKDVQRRVAEDQQTAMPSEDAIYTAEGPAIDIALSTRPYFHEKSAAIATADFYNVGSTGGPTEQVILVGYDTLIRIFNPKYYGPPPAEAEVRSESGSSPSETPMQKALGPFFARAKLRATLRTDDEWGTSAEQRAYLDNLLHGDGLTRVGGSQEWASKIELVEGRKEGEDVVSSTYARTAAKARDWERLDKMVTPEVRAWITKQELYCQ